VQLVKGGFAEGAMARSAEAGGVASTSPRDVAEKAEILITSSPNVGAFKQVMAEQDRHPPRGPTAALDQGGRLLIE
jgi:3-hydroxyisobutyrate dehydrogenase-like beta-hydroxyacid dehydrogenase